MTFMWRHCIVSGFAQTTVHQGRSLIANIVDRCSEQKLILSPAWLMFPCPDRLIGFITDQWYTDAQNMREEMSQQQQ